MDFHCEKLCRFLIFEARPLLRKNRHRLRKAGRDHAIVRNRSAACQDGTSARSESSVETTHIIIPASTSVSRSSGISFPFLSRARSKFAAHNMRDMLMKSELLAKSFPTQSRRPNPYVTFPAWLVSTGPGTNSPCLLRCLSGRNLSASSPNTARS